MENTNILVPSAQKIIIQGILREKKLEIRSGEKGQYISGSVIIKAADNSTVAVRFYANEFVTDKQTNEKKENNFYKQLLKVKDEYISEAEIQRDQLTDKKPTMVNVSGARFDKNDYFNTKTSTVVEGVCIQGLSIYELDATREPNPSIVFDLTAYLYKMADELKDGLPTGRKKCTLLFPVYAGKLAQMEVMTTPVVSQYLDIEGVGNTFKFQGIINNVVVENTAPTQGIGEQYLKPITSIVRETLVTYIHTNAAGSGVIQEGEEGYMSPELIKLAIAEREATINELVNAANQKNINDQAQW